MGGVESRTLQRMDALESKPGTKTALEIRLLEAEAEAEKAVLERKSSDKVFAIVLCGTLLSIFMHAVS